MSATFAGVVGYRAYDEIVVEPDAAVARTEAALDAEVDYNIPLLLNVIELADAEMYAALAESGDTFVVLEEYAENTEESDGFDMYRLPESLSQREGASYLDTGISSLDQDEAATLLNGSWRYTVYRYTSVAVRLQYANFDATDEYTAIAQAMNAQGWLTDEVAEQLAENFGTASVIYSSTPDTDDADAEGEDGEGEEVAAEETSDEADESEDGTGEAGTFLFPDITVTLDEYGVDSSGNTYQSGYIVLGELHYQFTIYTVTVEEMYGLDLPRDGMFVGIRLTKIIMDE